MAQQTAVEWLIEQLEVFVTLDEELTKRQKNSYINFLENV